MSDTTYGQLHQCPIHQCPITTASTLHVFVDRCNPKFEHDFQMYIMYYLHFYRMGVEGGHWQLDIALVV